MSEVAAPVAVIRFMPDGPPELMVFGAGPVRLIVIDECAPADRLYEVTSRLPIGDLNRLIEPGEVIGHKDEPRHAALIARTEAASAGRPHLRVLDEEARQ